MVWLRIILYHALSVSPSSCFSFLPGCLSSVRCDWLRLSVFLLFFCSFNNSFYFLHIFIANSPLSVVSIRFLSTMWSLLPSVWVFHVWFCLHYASEACFIIEDFDEVFFLVGLTENNGRRAIFNFPLDYVKLRCVDLLRARLSNQINTHRTTTGKNCLTRRVKDQQYHHIVDVVVVAIVVVERFYWAKFEAERHYFETVSTCVQ